MAEEVCIYTSSVRHIVSVYKNFLRAEIALHKYIPSSRVELFEATSHPKRIQKTLHPNYLSDQYCTTYIPFPCDSQCPTRNIQPDRSLVFKSPSSFFFFFFQSIPKFEFSLFLPSPFRTPPIDGLGDKNIQPPPFFLFFSFLFLGGFLSLSLSNGTWNEHFPTLNLVSRNLSPCVNLTSPPTTCY